MTAKANPDLAQLNLALFKPAPVELPESKQRELAMATKRRRYTSTSAKPTK